MLDFESNPIFEPDTVLASQLLPSRHGGPEHELMVAVLEDAMRCFLHYADATDRKQRALANDARAWFDSPERTRLYDFETVCDVLGIDAGYLRRQLARQRDARRKAIARPAMPPLARRA